MSTQAFETSYMSTIEHLPSGTMLIIEDVSWEDYKNLLAELGDSYGLRVTFSNGVLEVMSPSYQHEAVKNIIHDLLVVVIEETRTSYIPAGSITLKREDIKSGAEPDNCYYLKENVKKVQRKKSIDLRTDPAPDLVIEVDLSSSSTKKLNFYAQIGVTEFWTYSESSIRFFRLDQNVYIEINESLNFSFLTADIMTTFINKGLSEDLLTVKLQLRDFVRSRISC
jgi:Uma2 family endonuclease